MQISIENIFIILKNYRHLSELEIEEIRKKSNRDYYKPKVINRGFAGEVNNYIKYISEGDKDEKLSPGEYLNMIRPDLRDLINRHKPIERLNNNNNNNDNNIIMILIVENGKLC